MIVIGEKCNSSIPSTLALLEAGQEGPVIDLLKAQAEAGADYLDINTAICTAETDKLTWAASLAMKHTSCGIMLDSPSPEVIKTVAAKIDGRPLIVNSVTLTERLKELLPLVKELSAGVVALPIDENGIPDSAQKRADNALRLLETITKYGIAEENVYLDILTEAVSVGDDRAKVSLDTLRHIKAEGTKAKTVCGLSNVSFGLPKRALINSAYLAAAVYCGLDAAIMDAGSASMRMALAAAEAVAGRDEYCMNYITAVREA